MNYDNMYDVMHDSLMRSFAYDTLIEFADFHDIDKSLITEEYITYALEKWKDG